MFNKYRYFVFYLNSVGRAVITTIYLGLGLLKVINLNFSRFATLALFFATQMPYLLQIFFILL